MTAAGEPDVRARFAGRPLFAPLAALGYDGLAMWAWTHYRATVLAFAGEHTRRHGTPARLLEIGGGRDPLFAPAEAQAHALDVTVNDIDPGELARAPADHGRALFDVAGELPAAQLGAYDLVISKMVLEHVADVARAWRNVRALLAPGGVALAFIPTLHAPPFVINRLIPEAVSARVLRAVFPDRHHERPKFPAHYDWCFGDQRRLEPMLRAAGFADVLVVPFWTHGYFHRLPGLREADHRVQLLARARDWRTLTSYAYVVVRAPDQRAQSAG